MWSIYHLPLFITDCNFPLSQYNNFIQVRTLLTLQLCWVGINPLTLLGHPGRLASQFFALLFHYWCNNSSPLCFSFIWSIASVKLLVSFSWCQPLNHILSYSSSFKATPSFSAFFNLSNWFNHCSLPHFIFSSFLRET